MYQLVRTLPNASTTFISCRLIFYTRNNQELVRIDYDFKGRISSGNESFVIEGVNGTDVIVRTKDRILLLDSKNGITNEYPLSHPTEVVVGAHGSTLFLTTTIDQQGRIIFSRYDLWNVAFTPTILLQS